MLSAALKQNPERNLYCEKSNDITSSYIGLFRSSRPGPSIFSLDKYYYTTTSKLKITITRHQKILTKSKYKYNKLKNSERINKRLLSQEYLVVVIKTC